MNANIESQIRASVSPGNPFTLDGLTEKFCAADADRVAFSEIVADEYRRRLAAMPLKQMLELYERCYKNPSDANKDWLLGEIAESIEAERN